jgi:hypothetical protein
MTEIDEAELRTEHSNALNHIQELLHAMGGIRELLDALGVENPEGVLSNNALTLALEKISSLRNHAKCADETLMRIRSEHNIDRERVRLLRADLEAQKRKNDEAHAEIDLQQQQLAAKNGASLSPPLTEPEAALLRLVRQYGCLDEHGNVNTKTAQYGLDFLKASEAAAKGHPEGHSVPPTKPSRPVRPEGGYGYEESSDTIERLRQTVNEWCEYGKYLENELANRHANVHIPSSTFLRELMQLGIVDHAGVLDVDAAKKALESIRDMGAADERMRARRSREQEEPTAFSASMKRLLERAAIGPSGKKIVDECFRLAEMLVEKNISYGDSALNPVRIFARDIEPRAQILVRLDDKLSRLSRGSAAGEDVFLDLIGYLILYRIATATKTPAVAAPHPLDNLVVRPPTPEEITQIRESAAESEKNSPFQEFKGFVECAECLVKPGAPVLCVDCLRRRREPECSACVGWPNNKLCNSCRSWGRRSSSKEGAGDND